MELNVRDWLIILGGLVAAGFVLDAYRRVRAGYSDKLRMSAKQREDDDSELNNPELPNGGARVISRTKAVPSYEVQDDDSRLDTDGPVPVLLDSVDPEPLEKAPVDETEAAPQVKEATSARESLGELADAPTRENLKSSPSKVTHNEPLQTTPEPKRREVESKPAKASTAESTSVSKAADVESGRKSAPRENSTTDKRSVKAPGKDKKPGADKKPAKSPPEEIIVLHVVAPNGGSLPGAPLLQILLACDVRFGRMNIFHRYEEAGGEGAEQFSVVNMVAPGTFDLDEMENFTTPGISFFMSLPGPKDAIKAFDCMVETAQVVVKNLKGELQDEAHSVCTTQTLEHLRQRIRDFERRQLTLV